MTNRMAVPPIISDWLDKLEDPKTPANIKQNYAMMLKTVVSHCQTELEKYDKISAPKVLLDKKPKKGKTKSL